MSLSDGEVGPSLDSRQHPVTGGVCTWLWGWVWAALHPSHVTVRLSRWVWVALHHSHVTVRLSLSDSPPLTIDCEAESERLYLLTTNGSRGQSDCTNNNNNNNRSSDSLLQIAVHPCMISNKNYKRIKTFAAHFVLLNRLFSQMWLLKNIYFQPKNHIGCS